MNTKKIQSKMGFVFFLAALVLFSVGLEAASAINTDGEKTGEDLLADETARFLAKEGDTEYYCRVEEDNIVLYSVSKSNVKQLAAFPPSGAIGGKPTVNAIVDFGICGDWIIVSVGYHEGTGRNFFGDFARLKKDGSGLEHFWLTDDDTFVIVDDWIYYDFWTVHGEPKEVDGVYRIRPDGTGNEYMGGIFHAIYLCDEDGYVYGARDNGGAVNSWNPMTDLILCEPDGSEMVTLFSGETLPIFEDSGFMRYSDVEVRDDIVTFNVLVHGSAADESWRGHTCYTADYRVNKDGSGLTLLREEYPKNEK